MQDSLKTKAAYHFVDQGESKVQKNKNSKYQKCSPGKGNTSNCDDLDVTSEVGTLCASRQACSLLTDPITLAILAGKKN